MPICGSPWLFAAYRVLLRQSVPWHPPCALSRLISRSCVLTAPPGLRLPRLRDPLVFSSSGRSGLNPGPPESSLRRRLSQILQCFVSSLCSFQGAVLRSRFREPSKRYSEEIQSVLYRSYGFVRLPSSAPAVVCRPDVRLPSLDFCLVASVPDFRLSTSIFHFCLRQLGPRPGI